MRGSRRVTRRLVTVAVAIALFGAACGDDKGSSGGGASSTSAGGGSGQTTTTAKETPVAGGTATIQLFSEVATLDPVKATGSGGSDGNRFHALYGGLVTYNAATSAAEPLQAASLKPKGSDLTQWQLVLKPNMKFTDGSPFDADAVKTNWERAQVPANRCPCLGVAATIASMTVVNPTTLDFTLKAPNAHFDKGLARVSMNYIASAAAIKAGTDLTQKAIGAGPFKLDEWIRDSKMTMSKNPDWLGGAAPVYLDKLIFQIQGNEDQRVDSFTTGQIDGFYTAVPGSVDKATKAVKDSYYAKVDVTTGQTFVMNTTKAPFDDVRIRKAVIQAIPIDVLAKDILNGSVPATYFSIPGTPWHSANSALPKYDPKAAQALIDDYVKEKGGPVKFTMLVFQQTLDQARAKFIQSQFQQLKNIEVDLQVNDSPTNIGKVLAGDYQWSSWGFPTLDPDPGLYNSAHSGLPTNYAKYKNDAVDKALDEARVSTDNTKRAQLYQSVFDQLAKDVPFFPYTVTTNGYVLSPKLRGGQVYEDGIPRVDLLWKKA